MKKGGTERKEQMRKVKQKEKERTDKKGEQKDEKRTDEKAITVSLHVNAEVCAGDFRANTDAPCALRLKSKGG